MFRLPKPLDFADGQRQFFGVALVAAGIAFCILGTVLTGIIIFGPWSAGSETLRLYLVGGALASYFIGSIAVIVSLSIGGPVGRYKVKGGKDGFEIDAAAHGEPAVTVVQSTTVAAPQGPVSDFTEHDA